ncbi:MAG: N-acetyltransferase family protein [Vulcanimicrobiota bacterium]
MIETKELCPELWPDLESLFGRNGACGGCWCMYWRIQKGVKWEAVKGAPNKEQLKQSVLAGRIYGILAYHGTEPVGWCTFGPRLEFPRLDRSPSLKCDDAALVWSVPCFFVKSRFRGKGAGRALLRHAIQAMMDKGAKIAEGYPSKPGKDGKYISAFSWTGTISLFEKEGFEIVGDKAKGKLRVRRQL